MYAHILIAFLAYCLQVTLKNRLSLHAPGLTPTAVMEKLAMIQMIDVWIPTLDGRWLILPRYTQPEKDTKIFCRNSNWSCPLSRRHGSLPILRLSSLPPSQPAPTRFVVKTF